MSQKVGIDPTNTNCIQFISLIYGYNLVPMIFIPNFLISYGTKLIDLNE